MANIARKNVIISKILDSSSLVFKRAIIIFCNFWYFVTVRNGLNTLNERKIVRLKLILLFANRIGRYDETTIVKSRIFQTSFKYAPFPNTKPNASILTIISIVYRARNTLSNSFKNYISAPLSLGSSNAKDKLLATITSNEIVSKRECFNIF